MRTLTLNQADKERQLYGSEFIFIGSSPIETNCTQAGYDPTGLKDGVIECKALINQLRRINGQEPEECEFFILENHHEFGIYHEAAIFYTPTQEPDYETYQEPEESPSEIYALKCEQLPDVWDSAALHELRAAGHSQYQPAKVIQLKIAS